MTTAQPTSAKLRIIIVAAPPHDWPIYLREQYIGLTLPVRTKKPHYPFGPTKKYVVSFKDFLCALDQHAPEMAKWQREYAEAAARSDTTVSFPADVCREIPFPSALEDVMHQDLTGFAIKPCSYLALTHDRINRFPARDAVTKQMIVCADPEALHLVRMCLPKHTHYVKQTRYLVHLTEGYGFDLESACKLEAPRQPILSKQRVEQMLTASEHPFEWTPGFLF